MEAFKAKNPAPTVAPVEIANKTAEHFAVHQGDGFVCNVVAPIGEVDPKQLPDHVRYLGGLTNADSAQEQPALGKGEQLAMAPATRRVALAPVVVGTDDENAENPAPLGEILGGEGITSGDAQMNNSAQAGLKSLQPNPNAQPMPQEPNPAPGDPPRGSVPGGQSAPIPENPGSMGEGYFHDDDHGAGTDPNANANPNPDGGTDPNPDENGGADGGQTGGESEELEELDPDKVEGPTQRKNGRAK